MSDLAYSSYCSNRRAFDIFTLANHLSLTTTHFLGTSQPSNPLLPQRCLPEEELEKYTDEGEGFTLLKPSSWAKVDKAGATALFEHPAAKAKANSIGVVVNPVKISCLTDFGSANDVADKLIQAERRKLVANVPAISWTHGESFGGLRRKESTKEAEVIQVRERASKGGFRVYEFEYIIDSTRGGVKRIFSATFVVSKKLYLLNISHFDSQANPLNAQIKKLLEKVLVSFDLST